MRWRVARKVLRRNWPRLVSEHDVQHQPGGPIHRNHTLTRALAKYAHRQFRYRSAFNFTTGERRPWR